MYILPELAFYTKAFNDFTYFNKVYLDIAFNKNNTFVINREIINFIEGSLDYDNRDYFASFLKEIYDNDRYEKVEALDINDYEESCLNYYEASNKEFLIPIKNSDNSKFNRPQFKNILNMSSSDEYDNILKELLTTSYIQVTYQDFKSNKDIDSFVENLFAIPKFINEVHCFNRDISTRFIEKLKGKRINYFALIKHPIRNYIDEYRQTKNEIKHKISGKFKLFTITDRTLIHERKIFINNLCINFDNAFENILIEEPTWEISITYSQNKFENWKLKTKEFRPLN
jgi:hypothetical protein